MMVSKATEKRAIALLCGTMAAVGLQFAGGSGARAADPVKITVAAVGRPPIFSNMFVDVAEAAGFFKDDGLDVSARWFQKATDTAKSILTGDADVGWTASAPGLNLMASGAPVVAIAGMPLQDWIVASDEPATKACPDLKGKVVATDGINAARYLFLGAVGESCGVHLSDMKPIDLANASLVKAGIAGQIHAGVFHVDELAQIEVATGKTWNKVPAPAAIAKGLHYGMILTSRKEIAENREGLVRFLMAWIQTQRMMSSTQPADRSKFADVVVKATQMDPKVATASIGSLQAAGYWVNDDGLDQNQMMSQVAQLVSIGTIKPDNAPTFDKIVDRSLYAEAAKRLASR